MRSGFIGFIFGVFLMIAAFFVVQIMVIRNSAPDIEYRYLHCVFATKEFPWSYLDQGRVLTRLLFPVKIHITYYDAQYNEVTEANKPGRYGAVVRIGLNGGVSEYRYVTLFRTPSVIFWSKDATKVSAQLPLEIGIDPTVLNNQESDIGGTIKGDYFENIDSSQRLAILLAGLSETSPADPPAVRRTDVASRDAAWWFGLRERLGLTKKYPYLVDFPQGYDADTNKRWPLILFLHGGGEKGHRIETVRDIALPHLLAEGKKIPAVVITPQLDSDDWQNELLEKLLDDVSAKYRIDPDRIYVTGLSLGGDAAWNLAMAEPNRLAAIVPIASDGDFADAARIKDLPVWTFQGLLDPIVSPDNTIRMVDALRKAGGHPHLTLYPTVKHEAWEKAYASDDLYTWLFAQKRGQPEVITPGLPSP